MYWILRGNYHRSSLVHFVSDHVSFRVHFCYLSSRIGNLLFHVWSTSCSWRFILFISLLVISRSFRFIDPKLFLLSSLVNKFGLANLIATLGKVYALSETTKSIYKMWFEPHLHTQTWLCTSRFQTEVKHLKISSVLWTDFWGVFKKAFFLSNNLICTCVLLQLFEFEVMADGASNIFVWDVFQELIGVRVPFCEFKTTKWITLSGTVHNVYNTFNLRCLDIKVVHADIALKKV